MVSLPCQGLCGWPWEGKQPMVGCRCPYPGYARLCMLMSGCVAVCAWLHFSGKALKLVKVNNTGLAWSPGTARLACLGELCHHCAAPPCCCMTIQAMSTLQRLYWSQNWGAQAGAFVLN